jgi:hypothetical protein
MDSAGASIWSIRIRIELKATIRRHQQDFLARAKVRTLLPPMPPSRMKLRYPDTFSRHDSAPPGLRWPSGLGVLPWTIEDLDVGIKGAASGAGLARSGMLG